MYTKAQVIALQKDAAKAAEKARSAYTTWSKGRGSDMGLVTFGADPAPAPAPVKGPSATARAKLMAPSISDRATADKVLDLTEKYLAQADQKSDQVGFVHNFTGLKQSMKDGVASSRFYISQKLKPSLPASGLLNEKQRSQVALVVVLAEDMLKRYDEVLNDREIQFWPNFRKALVEIIGSAAGLAKDAAVAAGKAIGWQYIVPIAVVATAIGGLALYAYGRGTGAARAAIV